MNYYFSLLFHIMTAPVGRSCLWVLGLGAAFFLFFSYQIIMPEFLHKRGVSFHPSGLLVVVHVAAAAEPESVLSGLLTQQQKCFASGCLFHASFICNTFSSVHIDILAVTETWLPHANYLIFLTPVHRDFLHWIFSMVVIFLWWWSSCIIFS